MPINPKDIYSRQPGSEENETPTLAEQQKAEQAQTEAALSSLQEETVYRKGTVTIRDLISPTAFSVKPSFVEVGSTFCRTLFVISYPRYISVGWFAPVINFNAELDISVFFYPVPSAVILKQLKNKVGNLEAEIAADHDKGAPRDPIKETALRDTEQLRDDLTQGTEHFFQVALYVTIHADNLEQLNQLTDDIENIFGARLVNTKRVLYQSEQGFNSTIPLGNDELAITVNMNTSPAASSFPFVSAELTSDEGILYGINRHNNSLIIFDRFSMENGNMTVFATSGAGKSYAVKLEVLRSLMFGTDVIIIDPDKEYKSLSDAVFGTYVNISLSSESKINPFDLPRPMDKEQSTEDIIRNAVITLKGLIRLMLGKLNNQEDSVVDRALLETYAKKDITSETDLTSLSEADIPTMVDLQQVLAGMDGGEELSERLKKYTEGTFAGLFTSPTNVDMKNQLVTFSVRDLEDELRPIALYSIISYIWNVVRSNKRRRILAIDEAWMLMLHEDSAKFIFALVKRARKYYLGVTTITQDVNDFLSSPYGQAIVNNSALRLLLKQSPASIENIKKTFLLTEGEKYLLLEGNVGEGLFFAGNNHAAIKIIASYTEDQLITTNPQQLIEIENAKKEFQKTFKKDNQ